MYSFANSFRCSYLPAVLSFCLCLSVTARLGAEVAEQDIELSPQDRQKIAAAVPSHAPASAKAPRKLLAVSLHARDGKRLRGHPSIACGNLAIELMGKQTGAYTAEFSDDVSVFRPERLRKFDAVCFNNTAGVLFDDARLIKSLLDFVASIQFALGDLDADAGPSRVARRGSDEHSQIVDED